MVVGGGSWGRSLWGLVVVEERDAQTVLNEVGCGAKVVMGRQKTTMWQQSQHCLVIFWNVMGGMSCISLASTLPGRRY